MSVPERPSVKSIIHRVEAVGTLARRPLALRRDQLNVDGTGQAGNDLVLHLEGVGALLVEAFSPLMRAALGIDELHVEAHPFSCVLHTAFEDVSHAELAADLAGVNQFV